MKLSVLRRQKHLREAALNVIMVKVRIRGNTDCSQGVSTWLTSKRAGDRFPSEFFPKNLKKNKKRCYPAGHEFFDMLSSIKGGWEFSTSQSSAMRSQMVSASCGLYTKFGETCLFEYIREQASEGVKR